MPTITFVVPTWLIPLVLTAALYGAATIWVRRRNPGPFGIGAYADSFVASLSWVIGTLLIWMSYLIVLLVGR